MGAAALIMVVAGMMRPRETVEHTFRITLGLHDAKSTNWDGTVAVAEGEVVKLAGWRFEENDVINGKNGWKCQTHEYRKTRKEPGDNDSAYEAWPNGVNLTVRGTAPSITIALRRGPIRFSAADMELGKTSSFLDHQVSVQRIPDVSMIRPPQPGKAENSRQDDYPSLWISPRDGRQYVAWVMYHHRGDRILLVHRASADQPWSEPLEVDGAGDHFRVALAELADGTLWIVWSKQEASAWGLYGRPLRDQSLGPVQKLTSGAGPNLWHRMERDRFGRVWLVWQGFVDKQADIIARCADSSGWHSAIRVSASAANDWEPTVAADPTTDRVWIGWDTYDGGKYGIRIRSIEGGPAGRLGEVLEPEPSPRFQAHVSLACDASGRLWAAWDEAGPQWGKDYGFFYSDTAGTPLYASRAITVRCLEHNQWHEPPGHFTAALPLAARQFNELPQLQMDLEGRLWLTYRHRTSKNQRPDGWANQGRWDLFATAWLGDHWLDPFEIPDSSGRNDMRASSALDRDGSVYVAYASDNRTWLPPQMPPRNLSIAVSRLRTSAKPASPRWSTGRGSPPVSERIVHPHEKEDVAAMRSYELKVGSKRYHIYRGDLHRHTDISLDGMGDGSLEDLYRYALDAAALDFVMATDHNMGHDNEYSWWRTQQSNDLYTVPGTFIALYGYERSVPYPQGHRNIIWTDRGHRTLPLPRNPAQKAADTARVYEHIKETGGICTAHTSATQQGTDWSEHDDRLEPLVEIFQGFHTSYEMPGAPKALTEDTRRVHGIMRPAGFVSRALEKGYRLGFQASSDHVSTHCSYACILAEEFSRQGLVKAMKQRHTYAATDNIVVDFRADGRAIMGDEINTARPAFDVMVRGTGPLDRVELLRNGETVFTSQGKEDRREARFLWRDEEPPQRDEANYYYARVLQKDGQMAWSSPIWVSRQ
jgi:hypothetical protein